MKYKVYNEWTEKVFDLMDRTCYQGVAHTPHFELVDVFGEPNLDGSGDNKVQAEWVVEFEDGEVATIYDMQEDDSPEFVTNWHIGGHNTLVVDRIKEILQKNIDKKCLV